jgi:Legionella pneumophila major outer membrane protein precursor
MNFKLIGGFVLGTVSLLSFSPLALANRDAECCPALEIGLTGGWFTPYAADTAFATDSSRTGLLVVPTGEVIRVRPKYKFGGGVSLNYQMPDCCYNWSASYFWDRNHSSRSVSGNEGMILLRNLPGITYAATASSAFKFRYDFANIELGSQVCVIADCLTINPRVGLSYTRLKNDQTTFYSALPDLDAIRAVAPSATGVTIDRDSTFKGFGPSLGVDINYAFCDGFSLLGNFRYSAVVGTLDSTYQMTGFVNPINNTSVQLSSKRHFANLFQSEMGLAYGFDWCGYGGNIIAGYQLTKCVDSSEFESQSGTSSALLIDRVSDSGYHGPFLRLTMKFGL